MKNLQRIEKFYIEMVRRLHFIPLTAAILPLLLQLVEEGIDEGTAVLMEERLTQAYAAGLLLIIPAGALYLAAKKLRYFGLYLVCALASVFLGARAMLWIYRDCIGLPYADAGYFCSLIILAVFALDAASMRLNDNEKRKAKKLQDLSWSGDDYLLPQPRLQFLILFLLIYLLSLFTHSRALGDVALAAAVLYFFLVFSYFFLKRRSDYLHQVGRISNVPVKRIRRMSSLFMGAVLLPCLFFALLAFLSGSGRIWLNWDPPRTQAEQQYVDLMQNDAQMEQLRLLQQMLAEEGGEPPLWLQYLITVLENVATLAMFCLLTYWIGRMILRLFRMFRGRDEESGDEIMSLAQEERSSLKNIFSRERGGAALERSRIRRLYRRTILRYRGEAPGLQETPSEMEALADLPDTEEMHKLHRDYEKARYAESGE